MIGGLCIGYVAGVVTMVVLFVVGERFRTMDRTGDFEGRCGVCGKRLNIILKRVGHRGLQLNAVECPEHPGESGIWWPQRDDIQEATERDNNQ